MSQKPPNIFKQKCFRLKFLQKYRIMIKKRTASIFKP